MRVTIASAGTGKTTSLVSRVLAAVDSGTPLRRIACVTYTRSAAAELRGRLSQALTSLAGGERFSGIEPDAASRERFAEAQLEASGAALTTIHGFIAECLRYTAPVLGVDPRFETLPEWQAQALFEEAARGRLLVDADMAPESSGGELPVDPLPLLLALFRRRSLAPRFRGDPGDPRARALVGLFEEAYGDFEARLATRQLGPGELERWALRITRSVPAMSRLARRWRLVLVDEYQDVNPLQGDFFRALERAGIAVEVVGDPKQAVYGFRNADVEEFRRALREGEPAPALTVSYRHSAEVNRFLSRLTEAMAASGLGIAPEDAPPVEVAGDRVGEGRVELHWLSDDKALAMLRVAEARLLALRLREIHEVQGLAYSQMAVVARSHDSLAIAESALVAAGVPAVLKQGRSLAQRPEVRDLSHAVGAAVEPSGHDFLAWLRGPFGRLSPAQLLDVAGAPEPLARLAEVAPGAAATYRRLRELIKGPPLDAIKSLVREPLLDGTSFFATCDRRARRNLDAVLVSLASAPPANLELLLQRLDTLTTNDDSAEVPPSGEGVQLLTVHAAKGLEWPLVAVFDAGRGSASRREPLIVVPGSGQVVLAGGAGYQAAREELKRREDDESFRLFYVAASRPSRHLIVTASAGRGEPRGWGGVLARMGLGPEAGPDAPFEVHHHAYRLPPATGSQAPESAPRAAPWAHETFPVRPVPPVRGPSSLKAGGEPGGDEDGSEEPLTKGLVSEGEELPGRAAAVGTLVHYAISQSWRHDRPEHLRSLLAQEVMFPFSAQERADIRDEVAGLIANYWGLLDSVLPALSARDGDEAELPMLMTHGEDVWQGVIDRLYRFDGELVLEDYKTDREVVPRRYLGQLAVYARAVQRVRGEYPRARLVYLRSCQVFEFERGELEAAFPSSQAGSFE